MAKKQTAYWQVKENKIWRGSKIKNMEKTAIDLKIQSSRGRGKNGCRKVFIRPDVYCFNKSRTASGFTDNEIQESINNIIRKWYSPELIWYEIDGEAIVSNNEKNALTEYWRVCERSKIGKEFPVKALNPSTTQ